jgi:hypothetical protein
MVRQGPVDLIDRKPEGVTRLLDHFLANIRDILIKRRQHRTSVHISPAWNDHAPGKIEGFPSLNHPVDTSIWKMDFSRPLLLTHFDCKQA